MIYLHTKFCDALHFVEIYMKGRTFSKAYLSLSASGCVGRIS